MSRIVLRGGRVFDPDSATFTERDLGILDDRIAEPGPDAAKAQVIDATGLIVSPGLVDLHTHVFHGQDLGLAPDDIAARSGTTTLIDAGSAGGHLFGAFRRASVDDSLVRIRAFVNIASIGTTSILLSGELGNLAYSDEQVAQECIEANRDLIVGVKVRASRDVGGDNSPEALRRARTVADQMAVPLMVHLGPAPAAVDDIVALLGEGDILTHSFTGWPGNQIVHDGVLRASVRAARDRGALLDIGHGASGFSASVARTMIGLGELPDTISTDLHTYSKSRVIDFPSVLSKFLALGMTLEQVLARATLAPARAVGLAASGIGTLTQGAPADVTVLRREAGPVEFADGFGESFWGVERLVPVLTIMNGRVVFDALGLAGGEES